VSAIGLGSFRINLDAALERRNDPAISSKTDPLDIGNFAHIRRSLFGITPLGRQGTQRDLAGLGSHVCSEHLLFPGSSDLSLIGHRLRGVSNQLHHSLPWKIRFLKAYVSYYDEVRTHLSLGKDAPLFRPRQQLAASP
jgi:hypothetical protein